MVLAPDERSVFLYLDATKRDVFFLQRFNALREKRRSRGGAARKQEDDRSNEGLR